MLLESPPLQHARAGVYVWTLIRRIVALKIRSQWLTRLAGWIAACCLHCLARTLNLQGRWEAADIHPGRTTGEPYIYSLWHDAIMIPIALKSLYPKARVAALVSRHQDGSYLADFMRHVGIRSIRGSSRHGGSTALRELMRQADGSQFFITPDGPRGPRRQLKEGIIFLASQTGMPIVPVASACANGWHLQGSWTDLVIPKPFSTSFYLLGKPVRIPPDLSRAELEAYRLKIQAEMDRLDVEVERMLGGEEPASEPLRRAA